MSDARYCPRCGYLLGNVRDAIYLIRGSWKCPSCGYYGDGVENWRPAYPSKYYVGEGERNIIGGPESYYLRNH
jgi:hypothetical protein